MKTLKTKMVCGGSQRDLMTFTTDKFFKAASDLRITLYHNILDKKLSKRYNELNA